MTFEQIAIIIGIAVILVSAVMYLRSQRGNPGPEVGYVPRFLRPIVNGWFGLMNWPIPYNREGELIPVDERRRSRD